MTPKKQRQQRLPPAQAMKSEELSSDDAGSGGDLALCVLLN